MTALGTPIYDDLTLEHLETVLNDHPACWREDATAEWRVSVKCCGRALLFCGLHFDRWFEWAVNSLGKTVYCRGCGAEWVLDLSEYRVVRL